ncbi:hypothetical protein PIB30_080782 [Stylosanthes scabra]|uniref:F-box domain-containing protein n=1 Tax=Stylosanthes scabra TaxID=79078 RepID=A0ABU6WSP3_9FABA|nr:hypothetical protein [Stylosanthes scabra]
MRDILTIHIPLPNLPDEIITSIIVRSNSKTFVRCRSIASFWKSSLYKEYIVSQHLSITFGPCALLQLTHPMMDYPPGRILLWMFNTADQVCIRFPCPWELFALIGANSGGIFARCSMDRRTSQIIVWNPMTNNAQTVDVLVKTLPVSSIKILSKITLKMINKNNRELMESGRFEFDRNVVISEMFHFQPFLE